MRLQTLPFVGRSYLIDPNKLLLSSLTTLRQSDSLATSWTILASVLLFVGMFWVPGG